MSSYHSSVRAVERTSPLPSPLAPPCQRSRCSMWRFKRQPAQPWAYFWARFEAWQADAHSSRGIDGMCWGGWRRRNAAVNLVAGTAHRFIYWLRAICVFISTILFFHIGLLRCNNGLSNHTSLYNHEFCLYSTFSLSRTIVLQPNMLKQIATLHLSIVDGKNIRKRKQTASSSSGGTYLDFHI